MHLLVGSVTLYVVLFSEIKKKKPRKKLKRSKGYVATQMKTGSVVVMIRVKLAV